MAGVDAFEAGSKAGCSQDWLPHGQILARCDELCGV